VTGDQDRVGEDLADAGDARAMGASHGVDRRHPSGYFAAVARMEVAIHAVEIRHAGTTGPKGMRTVLGLLVVDEPEKFIGGHGMVGRRGSSTLAT